MALRAWLLLVANFLQLSRGAVQFSVAERADADAFEYIDNGVIRLGVDKSRGAAVGPQALVQNVVDQKTADTLSPSLTIRSAISRRRIHRKVASSTGTITGVWFRSRCVSSAVPAATLLTPHTPLCAFFFPVSVLQRSAAVPQLPLERKSLALESDWRRGRLWSRVENPFAQRDQDSN
jgi:hypothetical protein